MKNPMPSEASRITVDDAYGRYDRGEPVLFIDSRNPQAWSESKVKLPGAIRMPVDEVRSHVVGIPRGKTMIIYCT